MLAVRLGHGPGSRLWAEEALIALLLQLHQKEVVVLLCFNFLLTEPKMHEIGLRVGLFSIVCLFTYITTKKIFNEIYSAPHTSHF